MPINLVVDKGREAKVEPHIDRWFEDGRFPVVARQIHVGDYAICDGPDRVLAIIERKTLADYAATMKGERANNHLKMTAARAEDPHIQLFYIVEARQAFPADKTSFSRLPYGAIRKRIDTLRINHGIDAVLTKDADDTARKLYEWCEQYERREKALRGEVNLETGAPSYAAGLEPRPPLELPPAAEGGDADGEPVAGPSAVPATLTTKVATPDCDAVAACWGKLSSISVHTGRHLSNTVAMADFIQPDCDIVVDDLRSVKGRRLPPNAYKMLRQLRTASVDPKEAPAKLLSGVTGISPDSAVRILQALADDGTTLAEVLKGEEPEKKLAEVNIGANGKPRRLGKRAEAIVRLYRWRPE